MTTEAYLWQPPTRESLYQAFQVTWELLPSMQSDENNFPFLYDRKIAEENERYEVLPGLFGEVSNYYVRNPVSIWHGSEVWINNGEFKTWYGQST